MVRSLALLLATAWLASCNTVDGMGEDLQAAGRAVSNGAATVEQAVFDGDDRATAAQTEFRTRSGEPCDPSDDAVAGGPGLQPCRNEPPVPPRRN
ncbi:MAG: entericidin A/B family lipoprotein [Pseudomonadota bacterium]